MFAKLWVPHETKVYELAEIVSENVETGELVVLSVDDNTQRSVQKSDTKPADITHLQDYDDLCFMNNLHEAPLLHMLQKRFLADKIYTYTGNILISVNPYKLVDGLYDNPERYLSLPNDDDDAPPQSSGLSSSELPPHVNAIANNALFSLLTADVGATKKIRPISSIHQPHGTPLNQSIIVSGESGAGKTEASKRVMNFLISANDHISSQVEATRGALQAIGDRIKRVLVESNIIFESFGNSKTVRNDNSSRFGKYIKLQYTSDNQLLSAYTETFLLEKSRLVSVGKGERNYHIFYQLIRGINSTNAELAAALHLSTVDAFAILTEGDCTVVTTEDADVREFLDLSRALTTLGCSDIELVRLWEVVAVVLHLGNVRCIAAASEQEPCQVEGTTMSISRIAELLAVPVDAFVSCMTKRRVQAAKRGSVHVKVLNLDDVKNNVSALVKWLYRSVFSWLVRKVNYAHSMVADGVSKNVVKFIGILDIFGFEILGVNSFEQLCINYTNERLQQQFNEHVFVLEQLEYAREGLNWNSISFRDNQHVIDLISKKPSGLLMILEEHGMMNRKPDDIALLNSFNQTHDKVHPAYAKSRFGNDKFIVRHFAGDVTYHVEGFLGKNNNSMQDDLTETLGFTENVFLRNAMKGLMSFIHSTEEEAELSTQVGYVPSHRGPVVDVSSNSSADSSSSSSSAASAPSTLPAPPGGATAASSAPASKKMAATVTVSFQFRNQLDLLIATLRATKPHYIKCIKPNPDKIPGVYFAPLVMEQLRYSGALEVVRIRREGYPTRMGFAEFYSDCSVLAVGRGWPRPGDCSPDQAREYACTLASENLDASRFQAGTNMLFLSDGCLFTMHTAILKVLSAKSVLIQSKFRQHSQVGKYRQVCWAIGCVQFYARLFRLKVKAKIELKRRQVERAEELARIEAERKRLEEERLARELAAQLERERIAEEERVARLKREEEERVARLKREEEERIAREQERLARLKKEEEERLSQLKKEEDERLAAEQERLRLAAEQERRELEERIERERVERIQRLEQERIENERRIEEERRRAEEAAQREAEELARRKAHHAKMVSVVTTVIARYVRKRRLCRQVNELHNACRDGEVSKVKSILLSQPHLQYVLKRHAEVDSNGRRVIRFSSLFEATMSGTSNANAEILKTLLERVNVSNTTEVEATFTAITAATTLRTPTLKNFQHLGATIDEFTARTKPSQYGVDTTGDWYKGAATHMLDENHGFTGVLLQGWLFKKRGDNDDWKRRWCTLTDAHIVYFASEEDSIPKGTVPLAGCTISRVPGAEPRFEVFAPNLVKKKTFFGTTKKQAMLFEATSETELMRWISTLRACTGSITAVKELTANKIVHRLAREEVLSAVSSVNNESYLHTLVRQSSSASDLDKLEAVSCAHWLLENGCPFATKNRSDHLTAAELAERLGHHELRSAISSLAYPSYSPENPEPPRPLVMPGYTYVTFTIQHHSFANVSSAYSGLLSGLQLSVSVVNSRNVQIEPIQTFPRPLLVLGHHVYWGAVWRMMTPLEVIESDVSIVITLLPVDGLPSTTFAVDKRTIKSGAGVLSIANPDKPKENSVLRVQISLTRHRI